MNLNQLEAQLLEEEGRPPHTYLDHKGILTGGIGHNLIAHPEPGYNRVKIPVSDEICSRWFKSDIQETMALLDRFAPWWREHNSPRQNALLNLCFNMGWGDGRRGLSSFVNTLAAFRAKNYQAAAAGILNSQYAKDVGPTRSGRVSKMILTGEWPKDIFFDQEEPMPDFSDVRSGVVK